MYHLANAIVTTIGVEESVILMAGGAGLFLASLLCWRIGRPNWGSFAAQCLPLATSLYLDVFCWRINWDTVNLLRETNAVSPLQAELMLDGMYNDIVSITLTGCFVTFVLWVGVRLWFRRDIPQQADEKITRRPSETPNAHA